MNDRTRLKTLILTVLLLGALVAAGCSRSDRSAGTGSEAGTGAASKTESAPGIDLAPVRDYSVRYAKAMRAETERLRRLAERYHELAKAGGFDYKNLAANKEVAEILKDGKQAWVDAHNNYELNEGIVAGVPSLSKYDVILDAGTPGSEGGEDVVPFDLKLPDGRVLAKPGNFFHHLLEPLLWGTEKQAVALEADLNGDGKVEFGEVLPDANLFVAAAREMDDYTAQMTEAIAGWQPTLDEGFTAMVTMIPTMDEYFENWKSSRFVSGSAAEENSFVANSRLVDIYGILSGLNFVYDATRPLVAAKDAQLDTQVSAGFKDLRSYVENLRKQEEAGKRFTPEEADRYGTEAQDMAQELSALVAQVAVKLGVRVAQ